MRLNSTKAVPDAVLRAQPKAAGAPLPALTSLRFFAAFYVVLIHSLPWLDTHFELPGIVKTFLGNGYLAVCLFFVLSGFILSYTYAGHSSGKLERRKFWASRFARIYPVYLLSLLLVLPFEFHTISWGQALAVLLMVQAWNPLSPHSIGAWNYPAWSLSVEAFFYLCFPLLQDFLWQSSVRALVLTGVIASLFCATFHTPVQGLGFWELVGVARWLPLPILRIPEFIIGMVLGNLFLRRGAMPATWAFGPLALLASIALLSLPIGASVSLVVFPFGLLIYSLTSSQNPLTVLLSNSLLVLLGGASYSIYLLQLPVRDWVRTGFSYGSPSLNSLSVAMTPLILILFSVVVFRLWEQPLRRAARRRLTRMVAQRFSEAK